LFSARLNENSGDENKEQHTLPPNASMSQKLKHLIKSYGWYALGMYFVLSTLDFGVAFAAINLIGAEHVSRVANAAKQVIAQTLHGSKPAEPGQDEMEPAQSTSSGHEGLYAMIVLAYTVHKTLFLPVRVGLTAWLTPHLVHWLRGKGWAGSAGTKRAAAEMREKLNRNKDKA
jgi:N-terminal acetyltransferase 2